MDFKQKPAKSIVVLADTALNLVYFLISDPNCQVHRNTTFTLEVQHVDNRFGSDDCTHFLLDSQMSLANMQPGFELYPLDHLTCPGSGDCSSNFPVLGFASLSVHVRFFFAVGCRLCLPSLGRLVPGPLSPGLPFLEQPSLAPPSPAQLSPTQPPLMLPFPQPPFPVQPSPA